MISFIGYKKKTQLTTLEINFEACNVDLKRSIKENFNGFWLKPMQ